MPNDKFQKVTQNLQKHNETKDAYSFSFYIKKLSECSEFYFVANFGNSKSWLQI